MAFQYIVTILNAKLLCGVIRRSPYFLSRFFLFDYITYIMRYAFLNIKKCNTFVHLLTLFKCLNKCVNKCMSER